MDFKRKWFRNNISEIINLVQNIEFMILSKYRFYELNLTNAIVLKTLILV